MQKNLSIGRLEARWDGDLADPLGRVAGRPNTKRLCSSLPIIEQEQPDQNEGDGPHP